MLAEGRPAPLGRGCTPACRSRASPTAALVGPITAAIACPSTACASPTTAAGQEVTKHVRQPEKVVATSTRGRPPAPGQD